MRYLHGMMKKAGNWRGKRDEKMNRKCSGNVNWRQKRDGNRDWKRNVHGKSERVVWEQG
jgi:hypothetical protein